MFMVAAVDRTAEDWLKAAARRLASGGSAAVAIEPLARDMGGTASTQEVGKALAEIVARA